MENILKSAVRKLDKMINKTKHKIIDINRRDFFRSQFGPESEVYAPKEALRNATALEKYLIKIKENDGLYNNSSRID